MAKVAELADKLGDVNVIVQPDGSSEIVLCFMPVPEVLVGEGESRAVLALDASRSIMDQYGMGVWGGTNFVEMVARKLGHKLSMITKQGNCRIFYWALNHDGLQTEDVGTVDVGSALSISVPGPRSHPWGAGTKMLPVIRKIVEEHSPGADLTLGVIITDGRIEDEDECRDYSLALGQKIADGQHPLVKMILIGVGSLIDVEQLQRFDDLFESTPLKGKVDLYSSGVAAEMKKESQITGTLFAELMTEDMRVADSGVVLDMNANVIASYPDRLPGKIRFILPKGHTQFTVQAPIGEIVQDIKEAIDS